MRFSDQLRLNSQVQGVTLLLVTHDNAIAIAIANRNRRQLQRVDGRIFSDHCT
ncbi:MAG: hypothetical protein V7629_05355 [Motiliproteus sp.]